MKNLQYCLITIWILTFNFVPLHSGARESVFEFYPEALNSIQYIPIDSTFKNRVGDMVNVDFVEYNGEMLVPGMNYWFKLIFNNSKLQQNFYYIHFNGFFPELELIQQNYHDGKWRKDVGGASIPFKLRTKKGFFKDKVLFEKSDGETTVIYLNTKYSGDSSHRLPPLNLVKKTEYDLLQVRTNITQSFFAGVISILCLFSLVLFILTREKLYLSYFAYAVVGSLYFFYYYDYIEQFWFPEAPEINRLFFFCYLLSQVLYYYFLYQVLRSQKVKKWRRLIFRYTMVMGFIILAVILFSTIDFYFAVTMSDYLSVLNGSIILLLFIVLINKVSKTEQIILFGSAFLAIGGVIAILLGLFAVSVIQVYLYQIVFSIELVLFTIAVSFIYYNDRIERIRKELDLARLYKEKLEKEKNLEELNKAIDKKNRDLTYKAIVITQKESVQKVMLKQLSDLNKQDKIKKSDLQKLISNLRANTNNNHWQDFENHFISVHPNFYSSLNERYPNLTAGEYKLCSFLKMNLSSKEIALVTGKSQQSVDVARSRLRKKMGLDVHENIISIINGIKSN
ncbi:7TM diverse intracellular signaling domain-containing protein [uncultured Draconibacterium sp.]|uniref:7TM diverse intracellular signaling domain-containing protein n=1 Tax=uncultured Draconibacterium sp. TaxID=1573823 RepID=UPI002AA906C8|nr:7TM diverse intracellular signaling domain-containing protein [uncultured Draconibacterium sp.]